MGRDENGGYAGVDLVVREVSDRGLVWWFGNGHHKAALQVRCLVWLGGGWQCIHRFIQCMQGGVQ